MITSKNAAEQLVKTEEAFFSSAAQKDCFNKLDVGVKEWSCDISVIDTADDGILWHEMLHSCSAYFSPDVYAKNQYIEEKGFDE